MKYRKKFGRGRKAIFRGNFFEVVKNRGEIGVYSTIFH